MLISPAQWSSSVQLLQLASLCLHGTYLMQLHIGMSGQKIHFIISIITLHQCVE